MSDFEPTAPKPPKKGKKFAHIAETSEEEKDDEEFSGHEDAQSNLNPIRNLSSLGSFISNHNYNCFREEIPQLDFVSRGC